MNKTFKRFFAIILSAAMVFSTFTVGGFAKDKVSTKDNVVFSVVKGVETEETVEIKLVLLSGNVGYFDLESASPSEYTLERIEKSEALKEEVSSGNVIMACNNQSGRISFAAVDSYTQLGDMVSFIYRKPKGKEVLASEFTYCFSSMGGEDDCNTAIVFYGEDEMLCVYVSPQSMELHYKDSEMITVGISGCTDCEISFTSSDPKVVKVDENGNIYAAKRGSATITCTVTDSDGNEATNICDVKVKYTFGQWLIKIFLFGWIWY